MDASPGNDRPSIYTINSALHEAIRLEDAGHPDEAIIIYRGLAQAGVAEASYNLGLLYLRNGHVTEAATVLESVVARHPASRDALRALAAVRLEQARTAEAANLYASAGDWSDAAFYRLHLSGPQRPVDVGSYDRWRHRLSASRLRSDWDGIRPLRVGYVGVGVMATVTRFLDPVLAAHDPAIVEVHTYGTPSRDQVLRDRLDVAVDLLGHLASGPNVALFEAGVAPFQVGYIGYPAAVATVRRITDTVCDPADGDEPLIRLPGCCWAYSPDPLAPEPDYKPHRDVVFLSPHRPCKINAATATAWARIISADPAHRLMVVARGGENNREVRQLLERHGVPAERLTLVPKAEGPAYFDRYAEVDVVLDIIDGYGAMTICADALWMGLPFITKLGPTARSRAAASILNAAGQSPLVTNSVDDYVAMAIRAARAAKPDSATLRRLCRDHTARSPLCDGRRVAAALESAWITHFEHFRNITTSPGRPATSPA
jgi:predicted O-linked N-acetylglucosamine transferase (SPINDLY family)